MLASPLVCWRCAVAASTLMLRCLFTPLLYVVCCPLGGCVSALFGRCTPYYIWWRLLQAKCRPFLSVELHLIIYSVVLSLPCNLLYLIQLARLHSQETVHRNVCADGGDEDAEEQYGAGCNGQNLPSDDAQHIFLVAIKPIYAAC